MNIYARYFDHDTLAHNLDELLAFLGSIPEIPLSDRMIDDVKAYIDSDLPYPKRYKIRPRVYFILIKTEAQTMEEFKQGRRAPQAPAAEGPRPMPPASPQNEAPGPYAPASEAEAATPYSAPSVRPGRKELRMAELNRRRSGWYRAAVTIKRVITIPNTQKCQYRDTRFEAFVKADSGMECYDKIIDHLKSRAELDARSQFPSARGSNYEFEYLGPRLPEILA